MFTKQPTKYSKNKYSGSEIWDVSISISILVGVFLFVCFFKRLPNLSDMDFVLLCLKILAEEVILILCVLQTLVLHSITGPISIAADLDMLANLSKEYSSGAEILAFIVKLAWQAISAKNSSDLTMLVDEFPKIARLISLAAKSQLDLDILETIGEQLMIIYKFKQELFNFRQ